MSNVADKVAAPNGVSRERPGFVGLGPGDPAPWFHQRSTGNPRYAFDAAAGRTLVLCFYGTLGDEPGQNAMRAVARHRALFDDLRASFFGVSADPADETQQRLREDLPGVRHFLDHDGTIGRLYGALPRDTSPGEGVRSRRFWVVIGPSMRVAAVVPFAVDGSDGDKVVEIVSRMPPPGRIAGYDVQAPVLLLTDVFEPGFCRHLVSLYETHGGEESGFMREVDGKTVLLTDPGHKRRKDYNITDPDLMKQTQGRILRRVVPEIQKAHQFLVTRMERYIVSCYAAEDGGHFRAHRDNTTKGTAHRRFALSINLNDEFEGGELSFPEYGQRSFKPPPGGAAVFSCSLLHAVSRVTKGRRYAFLPFLYDDAAAKLREENIRFVADANARYTA